MKKSILFLVLFGLLVVMTTGAIWRTPVTHYMPEDDDERAISELFVRYIIARNEGDVEGFLSTLHKDCEYTVTRSLVVKRKDLAGMLPSLWSHSDGNSSMSRGKCMAWECFTENSFPAVMLVNPKIKVTGDTARAEFKYSSGPGLYMDNHYFHLVREFSGWKIVRFLRPMY